MREDLFTVVFEQVKTDTAMYADVMLPATTFLESYDIKRAYGGYAMQMAKPVIDAVGESRSNMEVFSELMVRLGRRTQGAGRSRKTTRRCCAWRARCPSRSAMRLLDRRHRAASGRRIGRSSSGRSSRTRPIARSHLFPTDLVTHRARGALQLSAGSGDRRLSAGADLTVEREDDQLDARRAAHAHGDGLHAHRRTRRRAASSTATRCASSTTSARSTASLDVGDGIAPGTVTCQRACGARARSTSSTDQRAGARHADRPRRRRLLQRRPRRGRAHPRRVVGGQARLALRPRRRERPLISGGDGKRARPSAAPWQLEPFLDLGHQLVVAPQDDAVHAEGACGVDVDDAVVDERRPIKAIDGRRSNGELGLVIHAPFCQLGRQGRTVNATDVAGFTAGLSSCPSFR